ncbi:MAG: ABC transporter permease [Pararhodobacter sp.]|nr:ABC transporter permease [Pararhodobacter sp.]
MSSLGLHRFHWLTLAACATMLIIVLMALAAPLIAPHSPILMNPGQRLQPMSAEHLLGTDALGRDLFSRIVYGARVSLMVGAGAALGALIFGLPIGLISGYFRMLDPFIMRVMDGMMAIPGILFAVALIALVEPSVPTVIIAITIPEIPLVVRLVRARLLSAREEPFVEAAVTMGGTPFSILVRHLLPATVAPLTIQLTYVFAAAILIESALSFLGIGIGAETPTWGNIMASGRLYFAINPWMILWPALVLTLCLLSINIIGDALRDLLDPQHKKRGA